MKALKDDRVLIGIGVLFFGIAFIDQAMTKADNLSELSIVGKTSCAIMGAILAWFVIKYLVIGMIFKRK